MSMMRRNLSIDRRRYWRIVRFFGGAILQIAVVDLLLGRLWFVSMAVRRSRPQRLRQIASRFRDLAVAMGGVMIKLGQFLSARVDVLPPEITDELKGLQDEVPPIPPPVLRRILAQEFGDLETDFAEVELTPLAAASLGQTMRAWLKRPDGRRGDPVVIKVLRANIETLVETDLAALRTVAPWLMRYPPIRRRADVPNLMEEFARTLWEELDYEQELRNIKRFQRIFEPRQNVYIPRVYDALCTPRALVMENVENAKIDDLAAIRAAGIDEKAVADALLEAYLFQLFKHGVFHADPHPGNIFIRPVGPPVDREMGAHQPFQIVLVDFGMVGRLPDELRQNLAQVLIGMVQGDARRVINAYNQMGFFLPGTDLERIIEAQAVLMERLEGRNLRQLSRPDPEEVKEIGLQFRDILFEFPFQVPQNFIYLGRALGILSGIASALHPEINPWYQIERYGLELLNLERQMAFDRDSLAALLESLRPYLRLPSQIQRVVQTAENGRLRVQSTDPVAARRLERIEKRLGFLNWSIVAAAGMLSGTLIYLSRNGKMRGIGSWELGDGEGNGERGTGNGRGT